MILRTQIVTFYCIENELTQHCWLLIDTLTRVDSGFSDLDRRSNNC
jgi:hypothetical protein